MQLITWVMQKINTNEPKKSELSSSCKDGKSCKRNERSLRQKTKTRKRARISTRSKGANRKMGTETATAQTNQRQTDRKKLNTLLQQRAMKQLLLRPLHIDPLSSTNQISVTLPAQKWEMTTIITLTANRFIHMLSPMPIQRLTSAMYPP